MNAILAEIVTIINKSLLPMIPGKIQLQSTGQRKDQYLVERSLLRRGKGIKRSTFCIVKNQLKFFHSQEHKKVYVIKKEGM